MCFPEQRNGNNTLPRVVVEPTIIMLTVKLSLTVMQWLLIKYFSTNNFTLHITICFFVLPFSIKKNTIYTIYIQIIDTKQNTYNFHESLGNGKLQKYVSNISLNITQKVKSQSQN